MVANEKRIAHLRDEIGHGELVLAVEIAQVKVGDDAVRRAARGIGVTMFLAVVMGPLAGVGAARLSAPPAGWVVVTDRRLLIFGNDHTGPGRQRPRGLLFDQPLDALVVRPTEGRRGGFTVHDRATGDSVASFSFGPLRRRARAAVLRATGGAG